jgi:transposase InsO family protein
MLWRGIPEHIRSDHGPEFIATELRTWLATLGARTLYIIPGRPWENGYRESFNGTLRDECLNGDILYSLAVRAVLCARGLRGPAEFSWERCARETLAVYTSVVGGLSWTRWPPRGPPTREGGAVDQRSRVRPPRT